MKQLADALTASRFVFAAVIAVSIVFFGNWQVALVATAIGIFTDAIDGIFARMAAARKGTVPPASGHAFDNAADGALCAALVFAPALRLILARVNEWEDGWVPLWFTIPLLVVEMFATPFFIMATQKLNERDARQIDIVHGWYCALLMVGSLVLITFMAMSPEWAIVASLVYQAVSCAMVVIKYDRATTRPEGVYEGKLTWGQFLRLQWT